MHIYIHMHTFMQVTLLLDSLAKEEDIAMHIVRLQKQVDTAQLDWQSASAAVADFKYVMLRIIFLCVYMCIYIYIYIYVKIA